MCRLQYIELFIYKANSWQKPAALDEHEIVCNQPLSGITCRVNKVTSSFDNCISQRHLISIDQQLYRVSQKKGPTLGNPGSWAFPIGKHNIC